MPEAYKTFIKTYERLATYTDPTGSKLDILVVYLQKETSLERARTAQRNFVARYLKDRDQKDAGLIAFVSPDPADWRFSLVKMEYKFTEGKSGKTKVKEEFTPAKRWSFLVGKNENSHTAQSRLAPIAEDDQTNPTLKQLEDAFNIEKVTKEFFEKYRELFLRVYETLGEVIKQHPDIKADFAEKMLTLWIFPKNCSVKSYFFTSCKRRAGLAYQCIKAGVTATKSSCGPYLKKRLAKARIILTTTSSHSFMKLWPRNGTMIFIVGLNVKFLS